MTHNNGLTSIQEYEKVISQSPKSILNDFNYWRVIGKWHNLSNCIFLKFKFIIIYVVMDTCSVLTSFKKGLKFITLL